MQVTNYRHSQTGYTILAVFSFFIAILLAVIAAGLSNTITFIVLFVLFIPAWLFSTMTVNITDRKLVWYFGPGLWKLGLLRENIVSAEPVRNKWWWGFGIRFTPHGLLYNVHGLDAVEITTKDGKKRRIGTDDPEGLIRALGPLRQ